MTKKMSYKNEAPTRIIIVGAGGIGGWVGRLIRKSFPKTEDVEVYDRDTWEKKNIDRQWVGELGTYKADTLVKDMGYGRAITEWFTALQHDPFRDPRQGTQLIFACVDNHPARVQVLQAVDQGNGKVLALICGNEYTSASAMLYRREFCGTRLDPRVRYPEILQDRSGDPSAPCTGQEADLNPQLALSNYLAAGYGVWLAWFWLNVYPTLTAPEACAMAPVELQSSNCSVRTISQGELCQQKTT